MQINHVIQGAATTNALLAACALRCCRFRAVHEEVVKLDQDFGATFSGVLTDDDGRVRALWGSYAEQVGPLTHEFPRAVTHSAAGRQMRGRSMVHVPASAGPTCKQKLWATPQSLLPMMPQRHVHPWFVFVPLKKPVPCTEHNLPPAAVCCQVDREEREWCAGLPTHVFAPWVQRLVAQDAPGITAPPLPVK